MRELDITLMEDIQGGGFVAGVCVGIGAGSIIYATGLATNFWNPIGWASAAFIVADAACLVYGAANI
ncbi:MAG: hypothetical protein JXQ90_22465 [Cyclobacteriaceae bacterium]